MSEFQDMFGAGANAEDIIDGMYGDPERYNEGDHKWFFRRYSEVAAWESKNRDIRISRRPLAGGFEITILEETIERGRDRVLFTRLPIEKRISPPPNYMESIPDVLKHYSLPESLRNRDDNSSIQISKFANGYAGNIFSSLCGFLGPGRSHSYPLIVERAEIKEFFRITKHDKHRFVINSSGNRSLYVIAGADNTALIGFTTLDGCVELQPWVFDLKIAGIDEYLHEDKTMPFGNSFTFNSHYCPFEDEIWKDANALVERLAEHNRRLSEKILPPSACDTKLVHNKELKKNFERHLELVAKALSLHSGARNLVIEATIHSATRCQFTSPGLYVKSDSSGLNFKAESSAADKENLEHFLKCAFSSELIALRWEDLFKIQHPIMLCGKPCTDCEIKASMRSHGHGGPIFERTGDALVKHREKIRTEELAVEEMLAKILRAFSERHPEKSYLIPLQNGNTI